jgi:hypothetical protein
MHARRSWHLIFLAIKQLLNWEKCAKSSLVGGRCEAGCGASRVLPALLGQRKDVCVRLHQSRIFLDLQSALRAFGGVLGERPGIAHLSVSDTNPKRKRGK